MGATSTAAKSVRAGLLIALWLVWPGSVSASELAAPEPPPVMLAQTYQGDVDLSHYWVSEKYDGVRAWWDGRRLRTRGGHWIHAPAWFTEGWPAQILDGELWAGRGEFEVASAAARRLEPDDAQWRTLRYLVFDLPEHPGTFTERLGALNALLAKGTPPWLQVVAQQRIFDEDSLQARLQAVVAAGGEGLMLHRGAARYRAVRTDDLLKLKPYQDAEAQVLAHVPGKGRHTGVMGALLVQRADGMQFRLGTGFSDAQRREPPPIGTWVTYAYTGVTANGVPRFARFVRLRMDRPDEPGHAADPDARRGRDGHGHFAGPPVRSFILQERSEPSGETRP